MEIGFNWLFICYLLSLFFLFFSDLLVVVVRIKLHEPVAYRIAANEVLLRLLY
jgi:hypothetical protein